MQAIKGVGNTENFLNLPNFSMAEQSLSIGFKVQKQTSKVSSHKNSIDQKYSSKKKRIPSKAKKLKHGPMHMQSVKLINKKPNKDKISEIIESVHSTGEVEPDVNQTAHTRMLPEMLCKEINLKQIQV